MKSASMDLETLQQSVPDEHSGEEEDTESDEPLQLEALIRKSLNFRELKLFRVWGFKLGTFVYIRGWVLMAKLKY